MISLFYSALHKNVSAIQNAASMGADNTNRVYCDVIGCIVTS